MPSTDVEYCPLKMCVVIITVILWEYLFDDHCGHIGHFYVFVYVKYCSSLWQRFPNEWLKRFQNLKYLCCPFSETCIVNFRSVSIVPFRLYPFVLVFVYV